MSKQNRNVSCLPAAHLCNVDACVIDMRHRVKGPEYGPRSIFTKHLISGSTDPGSVIRPLWSMKAELLLKGKTYRGSAPIMCCVKAAPKHSNKEWPKQTMGLLSEISILSPWHIQWVEQRD